MAEAGRAHGLLNTFLRLNKSFKKASMNIISDSDGQLQVTSTVTLPGPAYQTPRRGSGQSRSQGGRPGTRAPPPKAPKTPATPTPPLYPPLQEGEESEALLLQLLQLLQFLQLQPLSLPEGPGAVDLGPCSETSE